MENKIHNLQVYVNCKKEGQSSIYYMTGESRKAVEHPPFIGKLRKRSSEVGLTRCHSWYSANMWTARTALHNVMPEDYTLITVLYTSKEVLLKSFEVI